jgi:hypothetical protein
MIFWFDIIIKALYIYIASYCILGKLLILSTGIPPSRNPTVRSVNDYIEVCKFSVKHLAREVRFVGFATLRPFTTNGKVFIGSGTGDPFVPRCHKGYRMSCGILFPRDYMCQYDRYVSTVQTADYDLLIASGIVCPVFFFFYLLHAPSQQ